MAQDEISKKVELNWLSAFYGGLLTDKQRQVLTLHCEEDLSLTEIAQEVGISRQGVHELLTRAARKMFEMEEKLHVAARFQRVENGLEKCRAMMREGRYDDAERMIDACAWRCLKRTSTTPSPRTSSRRSRRAASARKSPAR